MSDIKVGDRVRSYDFPGFRDDCYCEGVVEMITEPIEGCRRYKIKVEKAVWANAATDVAGENPYIYPPVNGTRRLFGASPVCDGVQLLKENSDG